MGYKNTLYVTGFARTVKARDLAPYFDKYGDLIRVDIPPTKTPDGPPFAFVEYSSSEDCLKALDDMTKNPVILSEEDRHIPTPGEYRVEKRKKDTYISGKDDNSEQEECSNDENSSTVIPEGALRIQLARSTPHPPRSQQYGPRRERDRFGYHPPPRRSSYDYPPSPRRQRDGYRSRNDYRDRDRPPRGYRSSRDNYRDSYRERERDSDYGRREHFDEGSRESRERDRSPPRD